MKPNTAPHKDKVTQSFDLGWESFLDLKAIVYELKMKNPRYTQRKAMEKGIELLKRFVENHGFNIDHSKIIDEVNQRGALIRDGINKNKPEQDRPSVTQQIQDKIKQDLAFLEI